jgi:hypothetical protein
MRCTQDKCDGDLRQSPWDLLMYPVIHQYECRKCKHKYLLSDDESEDKLRSHFYQEKDLFHDLDFLPEEVRRKYE